MFAMAPRVVLPRRLQPRRPLAFLAAFVLAFAALPIAAQEPDTVQPPGTFVTLSDLHFNPFYDPALVPRLVQAEARDWPAIFAGSRVTAISSYKADVNVPLLDSTLEALRRLGGDPDFVLISGDFLGHHFEELFQQESPDPSPRAYQAFVRKTLEFLTARLRSTFPGKPVFAALGNDDDFCGDYEVQPRGPFLSMLKDVWAPLPGDRPGTFAQTFPIGGFYSAPHPTIPRLRLVVLNTVLFSRKYKNACAEPGSGGDPGSFELGWLEGVLAAAARDGERVWLLYHLPPGIDVYATLGNGVCPSTPVPLWTDDATAGFFQVLADHPGVVAASFAGHTHVDEIRLPPAGSFIHGTPAVSPVYANNPGFQVFSYSRSTGVLLDQRTYFLDVSAPAGEQKWALEYDFQQAYHQSGYDAAALQSVRQAIGESAEIRDRFLTFYPVRSPQSGVDPANWKAYWCGIDQVTPADFARCLCPAAVP
jgi:sphingomyelin phosphodiesterase acid-like 3